MKYSNGDFATIVKTNSNLDGTLVKVIGITSIYPEFMEYIVTKVNNEYFVMNDKNWTSITITEHCLTPNCVKYKKDDIVKFVNPDKILYGKLKIFATVPEHNQYVVVLVNDELTRIDDNHWLVSENDLIDINDD